MNPREVVEFGKKHGATMVDLRFIDLPGKWQHMSLPFELLGERTFEEGVGFDGSSIRGFQPINISDMLLVPDPSSARMDPFAAHPTRARSATRRRRAVARSRGRACSGTRLRRRGR